VRAEGRTAHDAGEAAMDALTLVRALWNLQINMGTSWGRTSGYRPALNRILSGPGYTVHHANGQLAAEPFWYEKLYSPMVGSDRFLHKNWFTIDRNRQFWQRRLKGCKYRDRLERALCRYALALDDADLEGAFLKLWSVLETVTATRYAKYDNTIRRATFTWNDRPFHKQVLQHLRLRRNAHVHESTFDGDPEQSVYTVKRYVEPLLRFHLNNRFGFKSLDEAAKLLDMPTDLETLKRDRKLLSEAIACAKAKSSP